MIEVSQLVLLVLIEAIIGLLILSGVLLFFALRRKGRIRNAAHHLAERVKSDKPARSERLKSLLKEKYGYQDEALEQAVHTISQAEMHLFQNLINGYIKDDQVHLQQVDVDEENLVLAYQQLKTPAGPAAPAGDESDSGEELARLQEENKRLSDELRVTMDTMGRMLNEYSSMFAGGNDKPLSRAAAAEAADEAAPQEEVGEDDLLEADMPETAAALSEQLPDGLGAMSDELLDAGEDQASALDDEVSEIIDEVMEMADEMDREASEANPETEASGTPESLIDELEQVDIEVPELVPAEEPGEVVKDALADPEPDPDAVLEALGESDIDAGLGELSGTDMDSALEELAQSESASALEALADDEPEPAAEVEVEPEPEAGSLEEEWAKLLEEDAESKQDPGKS